MIYKMISENEFDEILKKKGIIEKCRKLWWEQWKPYQAEFGGNEELLENLITIVIKKGCQAHCYS